MSVGECLIGAYRIPKHRPSATATTTDQTTSASPTSPNDFYWILASDTPLDQTHEFDPLLRVEAAPRVSTVAHNRAASRSGAAAAVTAARSRSLDGGGGSYIHARSQPRNVATPPRLVPERIQTYNPHTARCVSYMPPHMASTTPNQTKPMISHAIPTWLQELLSFRRRPNERAEQANKIKEKLAQIHIPDKAKLKRTQDLLTLTLLRAICLLKAKGEIRGKLLLSRQSPNNELKQLVFSATALAQETFEMLPPFMAFISASDLNDTPQMTGPAAFPLTSAKDPSAEIAAHSAESHSLPHSTVTLRRDTSNVSNLMKPGAYSLPASTEILDGFHLVDQDLLLESNAPSAPPHGAGLMMGKIDRAMAATANIMANHQLAYRMGHAGGGPAFNHALHCLSHRSTATGGGDMTSAASLYHRTSTSNSPPEDHPSVAPAGVFCPPLGSTPYGLPFSGVFGSSSGDTAAAGGSQSVGRRQSSNKTLFDGDRPLTPPAQGWYAKYSSGVTGVVWDRVHQAWVVSWTLAGKRTFRHFTCKSFGGFDKAREAAIEFRLARNRDIAAYNKRCKDRR